MADIWIALGIIAVIGCAMFAGWLVGSANFEHFLYQQNQILRNQVDEAMRQIEECRKGGHRNG